MASLANTFLDSNIIESYIKSGTNSFDQMLREFNHDSKVYAVPIFATENWQVVKFGSPLSNNFEDGFYLKNDVISNEIPDSHSLLCVANNRFFTSYSTQEDSNIYYHFYHKYANHLLFNLFNEFSYPGPFYYNKIINIYQNSVNTISEAEYVKAKKRQITEENTLGFVCCDVVSNKNSCESVLFVLTYEPIFNINVCDFGLYDFPKEKLYYDSKYIHSNHKKIITWALFYEIQKEAGIKCDKLSINDSEKFDCLLQYISSHYDSLSNDEKGICAFLFPDKYKINNQEKVLEERLHVFVTNFGTIVRKQGLYLGYSMEYHKEYVEQLGKVLKEITVWKKYFLKDDIDYKVDAILVLTLINILSQEDPVVKKITALWTYYHLITFNKQSGTNITFALSLYIYRYNLGVFAELINKIKSEKLIIKKERKGWLRTKIIKEDITWSTYDDIDCYFEILEEYRDYLERMEFNEFEKDFLSICLISDLENSFGQYSSMNFPNENIKQQRLFFKTKLDDIIVDRINSGIYYLDVFSLESNTPEVVQLADQVCLKHNLRNNSSVVRNALLEFYFYVGRNSGRILIDLNPLHCSIVGRALTIFALKYPNPKDDREGLSIAAENAYYCLGKGFLFNHKGSEAMLLFDLLTGPAYLLDKRITIEKFEEVDFQGFTTNTLLNERLTHINFSSQNLSRNKCLKYRMEIARYLLDYFYDIEHEAFILEETSIEDFLPSIESIKTVIENTSENNCQEEIRKIYFNILFHNCEDILIKYKGLWSSR